VTPAQAHKIEQAIEKATQVEPIEAEAVADVDAAVTTAPVDIGEIIANDPNQIIDPPAKPKRGWWRR